MNMKKNKPIEQPEAATHGRIKTTRRHLDSDSDDDDLWLRTTSILNNLGLVLHLFIYFLKNKL